MGQDTELSPSDKLRANQIITGLMGLRYDNTNVTIDIGVGKMCVSSISQVGYMATIIIKKIDNDIIDLMNNGNNEYTTRVIAKLMYDVITLCRDGQKYDVMVDMGRLYVKELSSLDDTQREYIIIAEPVGYAH